MLSTATSVSMERILTLLVDIVLLGMQHSSHPQPVCDTSTCLSVVFFSLFHFLLHTLCSGDQNIILSLWAQVCVPLSPVLNYCLALLTFMFKLM